MKNRTCPTTKRFRLAKWMVWLFVAASGLLLIYTYYRAEITYQGEQDDQYFKYYVISLIGIAFWSVVLRLSDEIRINTVLITTSLVASIYLMEITLLFTGIADADDTQRQTVSAAQNVAFDSRAKLQVILDMRAEGVDAFPSVHPDALLRRANLRTDESGLLFPLGGVSGKTTIFCNEGGEYAVYTSERYGFNNPDSEWEQKQIQWVLTGDSFTQGACVMPGEDIAGRIRSLTGAAVINLGSSGNGPLAELAVLKEYAESIRPKTVLWMYFEGNDLKSKHQKEESDLQKEQSVPILVNYMEPEFSQGLILRQKEIDHSLSVFIAEEEAKALARQETEVILSKTGWLRLTSVRQLIGFDRFRDHNDGIDPLFTEILSEARDRTATRGGQLHFVYLPEFHRYANSVDDHDQYKNRRKVIDIAKGLNIPVIDIHQEVFAKHPNLLSLFPLGIYGHYDAEGYGEVAKAIIAGAGN
jgi:hypothetical protein